MKANEFVKKFGWEYAKERMEYCKGARLVGMEIELKRLVESHDLVERYGGIKKAKSDTSLPTCFGDNDFFREVTLKKAIADVEGCL